MPFVKQGMTVDMNGKRGNLTSGNVGYVQVRFEGQRRSSRCHPQWEMTYYGQDGSVVMDYKGK